VAGTTARAPPESPSSAASACTPPPLPPAGSTLRRVSRPHLCPPPAGGLRSPQQRLHRQTVLRGAVHPHLGSAAWCSSILSLILTLFYQTFEPISGCRLLRWSYRRFSGRPSRRQHYYFFTVDCVASLFLMDRVCCVYYRPAILQALRYLTEMDADESLLLPLYCIPICIHME
jgi:hypothetical protein